MKVKTACAWSTVLLLSLFVAGCSDDNDNKSSQSRKDEAPAVAPPKASPVASVAAKATPPAPAAEETGSTFKPEINGGLGSPAATTTISGKQLPPPDPKFGGAINDSALKSKAWWAP